MSREFRPKLPQLSSPLNVIIGFIFYSIVCNTTHTHTHMYKRSKQFSKQFAVQMQKPYKCLLSNNTPTISTHTCTRCIIAWHMESIKLLMSSPMCSKRTNERSSRTPNQSMHSTKPVCRPCEDDVPRNILIGCTKMLMWSVVKGPAGHPPLLLPGKLNGQTVEIKMTTFGCL